jgi:hypothetical protein
MMLAHLQSAQVPMAKASVLWLVGEYCSLVPKIAPDVLRKAAKSFVEEVRPHPLNCDHTHYLVTPSFASQEDIVKLQTVNLAAKLCIANAKQSKILCQYVLSLAKYDLNYDIRDRARFLQRLVLPSDVSKQDGDWLIYFNILSLSLHRKLHCLSMLRRFYWPPNLLPSWSPYIRGVASGSWVP